METLDGIILATQRIDCQVLELFVKNEFDDYASCHLIASFKDGK